MDPTFTCGDCGGTAPRTGTRQIRCAPCAAAARLRRSASYKRAWRAANPETQAARLRDWSDKNQDRVRARNQRVAVERHSLTVEQFEEMAKGGCWICGGDEPIAGRRLSLDHDHSCCPGIYSCGACLRGVLCSTNNVALRDVDSGKREPTPAEASYLQEYASRRARRS